MLTMKTIIQKTKEYFPQISSCFACGFDDFEEYDEMLSQYGGSLDALMIRKYGSWIYDEEINPENVTRDVIVNFRNDFNSYLFLNKNNFYMLLKAMNGTYDPLANYDKNSKITTTHNGKEKNDTTDTRGQTTTETTDKIAPDNDNEFYNSNYTNSTTGQVQNSSSHTLEYENRNDVVEEHTTGNIGIMHGADMLSKEIGVRYTPIFEYIISGFIKSRCW